LPPPLPPHAVSVAPSETAPAAARKELRLTEEGLVKELDMVNSRR
jgi:hypothetical protein